MRELILYIAISEDGYIARTDGTIDWLTSISFSDGEDGGFHALYERIDTILMGRKTFEHVLHLTDQIYPHQDRKTLLITKKVDYAVNTAMHGNQLTVLNSDIVKEISRLKEEPGGAIWLCGGATIINHLMHAMLIDELIITVVPVHLDQAIALWDDLSKQLLVTNWKLTDERTFDGCKQFIYIKENGI